MSNSGWFTKEDIMNDLAEVSGNVITSIDDRFAVRGERPPPINEPDEEQDEFMQMYGQYGNRDGETMNPDLSGITQMLRMVNDHYDNATYNDDDSIIELRKNANTVITISKLDPNVQEFIPKNVANNNSESKLVENSENDKSESTDCLGIRVSTTEKLDCKHNNKPDKSDASHKNETNNNDIDVTKKIDISCLNSDDIKDMREKLKLKITSKAESLKKKHERVLAIASLLKLYTQIPKPPEESLPLKLMTPEYFQTCPENTPNNNLDHENSVKSKTKPTIIKEECNKVPVTEDEQLLNRSVPTTRSMHSPRTASQESCDLYSYKTDTNVEKQSDDLLKSKEIEESSKKVERWLNEPEKKKHKSRPIFYGTVTFKRKGSPSTSSSETPSVTTTDTAERLPSTGASYIPSAYANELTKNYMERSQAKMAASEDIWTKLEKQLQEKDEAIKKKMLSTSAQT